MKNMAMEKMDTDQGLSMFVARNVLLSFSNHIQCLQAPSKHAILLTLDRQNPCPPPRVWEYCDAHTMGPTRWSL